MNEEVKYVRCPRCGGTMHERAAMNAISRFIDNVIICSECGTDEAFNGHLSASEWWLMKAHRGNT